MTTEAEKRIKTNIEYLNESQLRKYLASEAISLGRGGIKEVSAISGVHRNTISAGIKELQDPLYTGPEKTHNASRIRVEGGGRKPITVTQPGILEDLDRLVDPESYGNPENPLRWTAKSTRRLADELQKMGYKIQRDKVGSLLKELGFSLQQNQKMKQVGKQSPDRDEQFKHINSLNVYKYLKYLLEHLPETPMSATCLDKLAPWNRDVQEACCAME